MVREIRRPRKDLNSHYEVELTYGTYGRGRILQSLHKDNCCLLLLTAHLGTYKAYTAPYISNMIRRYGSAFSVALPPQCSKLQHSTPCYQLAFRASLPVKTQQTKGKKLAPMPQKTTRTTLIVQRFSLP